jgi:hypothetical protein
MLKGGRETADPIQLFKSHCNQNAYYHVTIQNFYVITELGMCNFFFESAIAIPQLEESTSAIAILQLFKAMLIRNCKSAIPQSHFFLKSAT